MTSISDLVKSYKNKKIEATKHRRQIENKLKGALSLKRRSSSGLNSLERRKEQIISKKVEITQLLNQYLAQRDSIQRLKLSAEERIRQEQEAREQAQQQSEYSSPEEKAHSIERLKIIDDKIAELELEIKQREHAEDRLVKVISDLEKQKTKNDGDLKKQTKSKPSLLDNLKSSTKTEAYLRPQVLNSIKREEQANRNLSNIIKKLKIAQAAKRKTQRKAAAKRKAVARRKAALKRKTQRRAKTKTSKSKRKSSKSKPKRKTPQRKAKRKSTKKTRKSRR